MSNSLRFGVLALLAVSVLTACGGDDDDGMMPTAMPTPTPTPTPEMAMFEVSITNLTANQPLSPPAAMLHQSSTPLWQVGGIASDGLENLAESGSPAEFVSESTAAASATGSGIIMPGESTVLEVSALYNAELSLTVATMLVNTNDAFTGVTAWQVGDLSAGDYHKVLAPIYDAGTEANSETAASIPGPAGGGEGFNATRDDFDYVARHPGVVTSDDGLTTSALNESHRFDNGAMLITVTRM